MSDESKSTGPTGKIEFIENHRPALQSGDYEITVSQSIAATKPPRATPTGQDSTAKEKKASVTETFDSQTRKFSVLGPRFTLEPQVIRAVFPPAGSLGEHSSVLPHISFHRSTLPWERFATPLDDAERKALDTPAEDRSKPEKKRVGTAMIKLKTPWLALLLFDQDELVEKVDEAGGGGKKRVVEGKLTAGKVSGPKACKLRQEGDNWIIVPSDQATDPDGLLSPKFTHESGQQDDDPVTVIDVARDLLESILPSKADVQLLSHVRQPTNDSRTPTGDQVATILANRLPQPDKMSVIHLVSLEGKYGKHGSEKSDIWNLPEDGAFVRLVSLKSWRFTCLDEKHSFKGLLHHLNKEHLFIIEGDLAGMDEAALSTFVKTAFVSHRLSVNKKTTVRPECEAWIIEDKAKHQRFLIRREKKSI